MLERQEKLMLDIEAADVASKKALLLEELHHFHIKQKQHLKIL